MRSQFGQSIGPMTHKTMVQAVSGSDAEWSPAAHTQAVSKSNSVCLRNATTYPLNGGKSMRNGGVAEVTPHTTPDALNGWWISDYSLSRLRFEHGRSSGGSEIAVGRNATTELLANAGWTRNDFSHSPRFYGAGTALHTTSRVYAKGYFRKDGTYVRPHSRK